MMSALIYLDGKISSPEEARVSVFDRGFLFGDGVYETGRSYNRCFLYLEEHWQRFRRSADRLKIQVPWPDEELKRGLFKVASVFGKPDVYFRTIVTRGIVDSVDIGRAEVKGPTLVHIIQDLSSTTEKYRSRGLKLATSKIVRNSALAQDPNIKTSNYLNSLMALQDVKSRGADDAIMCDVQGNLTEGTTFSIFGVTHSNCVITPALEVGILDSITRRHVIEIAKKSFKVEERFFKLSEFHQCREVFAASSIREVMPVQALDMMEYTIEGPVTRALYESFGQEVKRYVEGHERF